MSIKTIGNSCQLLNGHAFKSSNYVDNGIRIIRIANVQKGYIEDSTPAFYPLDSKGLDNYMLKEGDLLMSLTGNVGRVALLSSEMLPAALNQRVACLRLKDNSIDKKFLFHYLNSSNFENKCIQESKGVAQKNMSTEWLKRQEIPNFPYAKQREISKVLDNISSIIKTKTNQIFEYDQLIKSRFIEMFGNIKKSSSLIELCKFINGDRGKNYPSGSDIVKTGVTFINAGHLEQNKVSFEDMNYLTEEKFNLLSSGKVQKNDILYCLRGSLGKKAIVEFDKGVIASSLLILRPIIEKILPMFLLYSLDQPYIIEQMNKANNGSSQPNLSAQSVKNYRIILPTLDEQKEFDIFVKQVDKLKFAVQKSLDETQQLFDLLMQEYFG